MKVLKPSPERASTRPRRNLVAPPVVKGRHVFEGEKAGGGGKEGGGGQQGLGKRKREDDEFGSAFSFLSVNRAKVASRSHHPPYERCRALGYFENLAEASC